MSTRTRLGKNGMKLPGKVVTSWQVRQPNVVQCGLVYSLHRNESSVFWVQCGRLIIIVTSSGCVTYLKKSPLSCFPTRFSFNVITKVGWTNNKPGHDSGPLFAPKERFQFHRRLQASPQENDGYPLGRVVSAPCQRCRMCRWEEES